MSWEEFRGRAYVEPTTDTFVINGDERVLNEADLRAAYDRMVAELEAERTSGSLGSREQDLAVNRVNNRDDLWSYSAAVNLTYCINAASFGARYNDIANALAGAAADWQATGARVAFPWTGNLDGNCTNASPVVFNVRQVSGTGFLMAAFFPSWARTSREILVDQSSLNGQWNLRGLFRHELGHALGFRHEHTRPESGACFENNNWGALTQYDSASVMHYPQCNGTNTWNLPLTALDGEGARLAYPAQPRCESACTYGVCGACSDWGWNTTCYVYNGCGGKYPIP